MKLTRDQVRQRLRVMLYQEQLSTARIAKQCGMDSKTITLASNGEMTNRTLLRFERYFDAKDKHVEFYQIKENLTETGNTSKVKLVAQILKLQEFIAGKSFGNLNDKSNDELRAIYMVIENTGKMRLLSANRQFIEKYNILLWDKWDFFQWIEKIDLLKRDMGLKK